MARKRNPKPMSPAEVAAPYPRSHLFTVRLWLEPFGDDQSEVRMVVQHVLSGERRYFRDWGRLRAYLQEKLVESEQAKG